MPLALEGVKVLEMGAVAMVNVAGQWLGDLGADVIVVEPPYSRLGGAEWSGSDRFRSETNRNKRMIGLDLRQKEGQDILHRMAKDADLLIEANRPGIAKKLGFDYETLSAMNPRIIVGSLTGYGQKGPYSHMPGHGLAWEATAGWLLMYGQGNGNMGGDHTGRPWINYFNMPDIKSAPNFMCALLTALYAREKTGEGQHIDQAVFDAVIAVRQPELPPREEVFHFGGPCWNVYECKDGKYIAVAALEALQWSNLCEGLGVPEFGKDPREGERSRYRGPISQKAEETLAIFQRIFKTRTRDEWFAHLSKWDTEVARVNSIDEAAQDPQVKLRGMHVEVVGEDGSREVQYGTPFGRLSKTPARAVHRRAPRLGENTEQILGGLGYSKTDIARLHKIKAAF